MTEQLSQNFLSEPCVFAVDIKASEFVLSGSTIWMHFSLASSWAGPVAGGLLLPSLGLLTTVLRCRPVMPSLRKEVERWLLGAGILHQENDKIPSKHQVKPSLTAGGRPLNRKDFLMRSSKGVAPSYMLTVSVSSARLFRGETCPRSRQRRTGGAPWTMRSVLSFCGHLGWGGCSSDPSRGKGAQ